MRRLAREGAGTPELRLWVLEAVPVACVGRAPRCELEGVVSRMRRDLRFKLDPPDVDRVQHPWFTVLAGGGDCDCLSTLFAACGFILGWPVRFTVGAKPGKSVPTHVLPEAGIDGRWIPVEVSSRFIPIGQYPPGFVPLGQVTL